MTTHTIRYVGTPVYIWLSNLIDETLGFIPDTCNVIDMKVLKHSSSKEGSLCQVGRSRFSLLFKNVSAGEEKSWLRSGEDVSPECY